MRAVPERRRLRRRDDDVRGRLVARHHDGELDRRERRGGGDHQAGLLGDAQL